MANKVAKGQHYGNAPNTNIPGPSLPNIPGGKQVEHPIPKQLPHPFKGGKKGV